MNINRLHRKQLPLYPVNLVFSADGVKLQGWFNESFDDQESSGGFTKIAFIDDVFTVGIHLKAEDHTVPLSFIAHECFHATVRICDYLGVKISTSNDEAAAYIMTWLYDWILSLLKKDYKLTKKANEKLTLLTIKE